MFLHYLDSIDTRLVSLIIQLSIFTIRDHLAHFDWRDPLNLESKLTEDEIIMR